MRLGCLGALIAHLAEGQVGIVTAMPLALFWMVAAVLASAPWSAAAPGALRRRSTGIVAAVAVVLAGALVAALIAWTTTRWLLASTAYAQGARRHIAGQVGEAYTSFRRSKDLMPWLSLPAEAFASTALSLAGSEPSPARRLELLHEGETALAEARRHALGGATSWTLTAQLAFAEARAGERNRLPVSLEAFEAAARLRPRDARIMAQWAWAWLESGDPARARQAAEQALSLPAGHREWLPWAVLAASARDLGDAAEAGRAAAQARRLAPPGSGRLLEGLP
jgi:hypothetical protein